MTPYAKVAVEFATALVEGQFDEAHALLTPPLRKQMSPAALRDRLYAMWQGYADGDPERIHFDEEFSHQDWPAKLPGDLGWAYVGIEGDGFVEAVSVIVTDVGGIPLIRDIEWGRP